VLLYFYWQADTLVTAHLRWACQRLLGPAEEYTVSLGPTSRWRLLRGHLSEVAIAGREVQVGHGLVLDRLKLWVPRAQATPWSAEVRLFGPAEFEVFVSEEHLKEYLRQRLKQEELALNVELNLKPGGVRVKVETEALGRPLNLEVEGLVGLQDRTALWVLLQRTTVGSLKLPSLILKWLERKINPLVDFRELPFKVRLDTFTLSEDDLHARGTCIFD